MSVSNKINRSHRVNLRLGSTGTLFWRATLAMATTLLILTTTTTISAFSVVPRRDVARSRLDGAFSSSARGRDTSLRMVLRIANARGSAAVPYEKKGVAVVGAGGYLGATIFGFLQRAGALYGSGLAGAERGRPVGVCATAVGTAALNRVLTGNFRLAFAPENLLRLTDTADPSYAARSLVGVDAVVLGTSLVLQETPVTSGSYETGPNSKTNEIYLGGRRGFTNEVTPEEEAASLAVFRNVLEACAATGTVKHVVVVRTTPKSPNDDDKRWAAALDECGLPFTYVCTGGEVRNTKDYTYETGVQGSLDLEAFTLSDDYRSAKGYESGDWSDALSRDATKVRCEAPLATEDLAALVSQSLMSLDWTKSRVLDVGCLGPLGLEDPKTKRNMNSPNESSKYWVKYSELLETALASVE